MLKYVFLFALALNLLACSYIKTPVEQASGYLSEEISPGVYAIEVKQHRAWYSTESKEDHLDTLKKSWQQRASELCQHGYQGEPEIIAPSEARFEGFQCATKQCNQQPMISGIAWCHKRYQL